MRCVRTKALRTGIIGRQGQTVFGMARPSYMWEREGEMEADRVVMETDRMVRETDRVAMEADRMEGEDLEAMEEGEEGMGEDKGFQRIKINFL